MARKYTMDGTAQINVSQRHVKNAPKTYTCRIPQVNINWWHDPENKILLISL